MDDTKGNLSIIILAAGLGTRMKSDKAKVLHTILGRPMIQYVVEAAVQVAGSNVIVVTGHQSDAVRKCASDCAAVGFAFQDLQLGTGHAVQCAMPEVSEESEQIIILCGDVPLLSANTIHKLIQEHITKENDITVLAVELDQPTGYGRMIVGENDQLTKIVEEKDATPREKEVTMINSGIYCVQKEYLSGALKKITPDNAQHEYYLTDIIAIGNREKRKIGLMKGDNPNEVVGVNSLQDLLEAENLMKTAKGKTS